MTKKGWRGMAMPHCVPFIQAPGVGGEKLPVILRWQDLPPNVCYITAPEHKENERRKEKKSKAKGKKGKKGKAEMTALESKAKGKKGKAEMTAHEGPHLFNYLIISDFYEPCKMCPNPDGHISLHCSNLTPELTEHLRAIREHVERTFVHPDDLVCDLCLNKGHHWTFCPYRDTYPPGAAVGPLAEIICLCCGEVMPSNHLGVPGLDWTARADLKCDPRSPRGELLLMEHELARKAAADGTGNNTTDD